MAKRSSKRLESSQICFLCHAENLYQQSNKFGYKCSPGEGKNHDLTVVGDLFLKTDPIIMASI